MIKPAEAGWGGVTLLWYAPDGLPNPSAMAADLAIRRERVRPELKDLMNENRLRRETSRAVGVLDVHEFKRT
jgi:hypothetical protein